MSFRTPEFRPDPLPASEKKVGGLGPGPLSGEQYKVPDDMFRTREQQDNNRDAIRYQVIDGRAIQHAEEHCREIMEPGVRARNAARCERLALLEEIHPTVRNKEINHMIKNLTLEGNNDMVINALQKNLTEERVEKLQKLLSTARFDSKIRKIFEKHLEKLEETAKNIQKPEEERESWKPGKTLAGKNVGRLVVDIGSIHTMMENMPVRPESITGPAAEFLQEFENILYDLRHSDPLSNAQFAVQNHPEDYVTADGKGAARIFAMLGMGVMTLFSALNNPTHPVSLAWAGGLALTGGIDLFGGKIDEQLRRKTAHFTSNTLNSGESVKTFIDICREYGIAGESKANIVDKLVKTGKKKLDNFNKYAAKQREKGEPLDRKHLRREIKIRSDVADMLAGMPPEDAINLVKYIRATEGTGSIARTAQKLQHEFIAYKIP